MSEPTREEVPMCSCGDDWHAYNAANHAPTCPVLTYYTAIVAERDATASTLADCERKLDAAVRKVDATNRLADREVVHELMTLRARLDACEKIVEAARVWLSATGAEESGRADAKLASATYDQVVAERDAAVRERDAYFDDWKCAVGLLDEARDLAHENAERAEQFEVGMVEALQRLAACEPVVSAAIELLEAKGREAMGRADAKLAAATYEYRAAVAAETSERSSPITAGDTQGEKDA